MFINLSIPVTPYRDLTKVFWAAFNRCLSRDLNVHISVTCLRSGFVIMLCNLCFISFLILVPKCILIHPSIQFVSVGDIFSKSAFISIVDILQPKYLKVCTCSLLSSSKLFLLRNTRLSDELLNDDLGLYNSIFRSFGWSRGFLTLYSPISCSWMKCGRDNVRCSQKDGEGSECGLYQGSKYYHRVRLAALRETIPPPTSSATAVGLPWLDVIWTLHQGWSTFQAGELHWKIVCATWAG